MDIRANIRSLKFIAFFLFLTPTVALLGSLLAHNLLVSFNFEHEINYNFENNSSKTSSIKFECNKQNNYCKTLQFENVNKLNKCNKFKVEKFFFTKTGEVDSIKDIKISDIEKFSKETNQKIFVQWRLTDKFNENCILNSRFIKYYEFSPIIFEKIFELKSNKLTSFGSSHTVNPILYGEVSISNVVKRFPLKIIFKPLMYITVILMVFYWYFNNLILNNLLNKKIQNLYFIFGVLSAFFLLLHVIFLGWTFENKILTQLRRSYVVFFIFFEVLAQTFLIKDILKRKNKIIKYLNNIVVYIKLAFVILVCASTLIIFAILLSVNLDSKIDYILEWNYFLILLIFYILSSLMWKKTT